MSDTQKIIEAEVKDALATEKSLQELESELMQNEQFRQFIELSKTVPKQLEEIWKRIEAQMVEHDIKSIKGDYGTITIAERLNFDIDMSELPSKFIKKVADTKKIADTFRLEGKSPRGSTPKFTKYLTKRLK